jgi:hypothetical protein
LLRAEKLVKKARKVFADGHHAGDKNSKRRFTKTDLAREFFDLAELAQARGWSAEELLSVEIGQRERRFRQQERRNFQA